jgi:hypothetical protein
MQRRRTKARLPKGKVIAFGDADQGVLFCSFPDYPWSIPFIFGLLINAPTSLLVRLAGIEDAR